MKTKASFGKETAMVSALLVASLLLFSPVLTFDMLRWDDGAHILGNPYLYPPLDLGKLIAQWGDSYFGMYIPMTYTVWGLVKMMTEDPAAYHALNALFHTANGLMVFVILRRITGQLLGAWLGAGFFLLHPLVVEPVAWISGFKDVGSTFWGLLCCWLMLDDLRRFPGRGFLGVLCLILAVTSKPSAVVFVPVAGVLRLVQDGTRGCGALRDLWTPRRLMVAGGALLLFLVIMAGAVLVAMRLQPVSLTQDPGSWAQRPIVVLDALGFYLAKVLWPVHLLPVYSRTPAVALASSKGLLAMGIILLLMTGYLILNRSHFPFRFRYGLGLLILVIGVSPNLGIIPFSFQEHSTVADRYAYVALLGPALIVAEFVSSRRRAWLLVPSLGVLAFFTARQLPLWRNQETLFTYTLSVDPQSFVASDGLGVDYVRRGDLTKAEGHFRRAIAIKPTSFTAWRNLGSLLWLKGDQGGAVSALEKSMSLHPREPDCMNNLGFIYLKMGREVEAERLFREVLAVNRFDLDARYNLAQLFHRKGRSLEARRLLDEALAINPEFAKTHLGATGH